MKKLLVLLMAVGFCLGLTGTALAGNEATQTATYEVTEVNELTMSGNPSMTIDTATAGLHPTDAEADPVYYAITTNCSGKKITAKIDSDMPTKTSLVINVTPPAGASMQGEQPLSAVAVDVVKDIVPVAGSGLEITYIFGADYDAGVIASDTRTVTLTLMDQ